MLIFELRVTFRSRKMTCIPRLLICIMLVKRLWKKSGALNSSACLPPPPPHFSTSHSVVSLKMASVLYVMIVFSSVHYLLYILLLGCVSREEL